MTALFQIITTAITIYSFLCFIRIILTWIPNLSYSRFGQMLSSICDPYLNLFRKLPLRIGGLDFSPMIAFGILMIASSVTGNLALSRTISIGHFLAMLLSMVWSVAASLITFFIIFLIIRLIVLLMHRDSYSSIWSQLDYSLNPIIFRMTNVFSGGRPMSYKNSLIAAVVLLFALRFGGSYLINILASMLYRMPF